MESFANIKEGDIIRNKLSGQAYTVVALASNYEKNHLIVQRTLTAYNPNDWELAYKSRLEPYYDPPAPPKQNDPPPASLSNGVDSCDPHRHSPRA